MELVYFTEIIDHKIFIKLNTALHLE